MKMLVSAITSLIQKVRPELQAPLLDLSEHASSHIELAELDGKIVGLALINFNFAAFQGDMEVVLEALYVDPEERASHIDQALFTKIAQICTEKKYCRVAMNVPKESVAFYQQFGCQVREALLNFYLNKHNMQAFAARK